MSLDQVMDRMADAFSKAADGPNKTAIAIALLGRSGGQLIPVLDQGRAGMAEFQRVAGDTGTVITGAMAEGMEKTNISIVTLGDAFKGVGITLFEAFKPASDVAGKGLISLVEWFNNSIRTGGTMDTVLAAIVAAFDTLVGAIETVVNALRILWDVFDTSFRSMVIAVQTVGTLLRDLGNRDFGRLGDDAGAGFDRLKDVAVSHFNDILAAGKRNAKDIASLYSNLGGFGAEGAPGVDTSGGVDAAAGAAKPQMTSLGAHRSGRAAGNPDAQLLQQWRDTLDQRMISEKSFFADSKGEELAYWQSKLAAIDSGEAGVNTKTKEGAALRLQVERQVYALDKSAAQQWLRDYKAGIDEQLAALKQSLSEKEISEQEYYARSKALAQDWANVVAETYGKNAQQYNAALKQMDALDKAHATQSQAVWKNASQIITNSFDQMLTGMLRGTQTFQQAFARLAENLVVALLESIAKMTVNWALHQAQKLALATTTDTAIVAADTTQAAASCAAQNAVDVKPSVMKHAGSAAAAVYDDVSQIPYVGWVLAPPAAAAAFAAVAAFGSFDVGAYALPSDMIIQAHQGEMILPAAQAAQVRAGQASVGAFPSGGVGDAGGVTVIVAPNFNVNAWNGQDAANALKSQGRVIAQIVADHIKAGNSSLRGAMQTAAT